MRGAYGAPRVIPAGYAVKPPHPFVMTARLPFTGCVALGCDGDAAP